MWRNFHLNFEVQVLISGFNPKHGGWFSCSNLSLEEAFHCLGKGCLVPRVSVYYQSQSSHLELLERDFTPWLQNWPRNGSKRSEQLKSNLTDMNKSPPWPTASQHHSSIQIFTCISLCMREFDLHEGIWFLSLLSLLTSPSVPELLTTISSQTIKLINVIKLNSDCHLQL